MKEISRSIFLCLKAQNKSEPSYIKCYPKLKDLALEQYGNTPLEKAAFTLNYFFIDNDDNDYLAPVEIVPSILLYLEKRGYKFKNIKNMYVELDDAFQTKQSIENIKSILQKYTICNPQS